MLFTKLFRQPGEFQAGNLSGSGGILLASDMRFFPQDQDVLRSGNPQLDLGAGHFQNFDLNIAANQQNFPGFSPDHEHASTAVATGY